MGRPSTSPNIIERLNKINTAFLRDNGYISRNNTMVSGVMSWKINGKPNGSAEITVTRCGANAAMSLSYAIGNTEYKYTIQLVTEQSNLGKGLVWYFICPLSGKRCRQLYGGRQYFIHRSALQRAFYDDQVQCHAYRAIASSPFGKGCKVDEAITATWGKHFKRFYAGKPTRRYKSLLKKAGFNP